MDRRGSRAVLRHFLLKGQNGDGEEVPKSPALQRLLGSFIKQRLWPQGKTLCSRAAEDEGRKRCFDHLCNAQSRLPQHSGPDNRGGATCALQDVEQRPWPLPTSCQ